MSRDTAMAEARRLGALLTRHQVKWSIELQIGRPWSGDDWFSKKYIRMGHHTATRPSQGLTPALSTVKNGRPGIPGPLSNGYGGYDLIYRIITLGLANHPGVGGPMTIDGVTVPKDSARISTFGTEWEGGYEDWSPRMLEFMGRADAAIAEWLSRPYTSQCEHSTWATPVGRKIDRLNFNRNRTTGIALTNKWKDAVILPPAPPSNKPIISRGRMQNLANGRNPGSITAPAYLEGVRFLSWAAAVTESGGHPILVRPGIDTWKRAIAQGQFAAAGKFYKEVIINMQERFGLKPEDGFFGVDEGQVMARYGYQINP